MATILVVDDKELNRSVLTTLLGYRGHRIIEASSGLDGLDKARREAPDLVITDILMPKMDGYELVQELNKLDSAKRPHVIFYSAVYLEEEAKTLARACGVTKVICKPAEPEEILKVVDAALTAHRADILSVVENPDDTDAIKILSSKLYRKVEEVEELNAQLEKRVAVRTAELEDANRLLHEQIIERQKAEANAARNHEAHLKLKGEFLSHVSHELRSPLTVVHQFTTILLDGIAGKLSTTQREYLEITLRNINQLKHMIDDLLDASRSEAGKLTVRRSSVSLTDIVTQTVKSQIPIAAQRNIALKTEMPTGLPPIYADPARITQVLTNVLENAVKFSPASSAITIRSRIDESDPSRVHISVADCGCGIKPEDAERVFDRLYQVKNSTETSRKGLGLGLYISKELVDLHGGRIWIDKTTKTGTTVHLTFPIFTIKGLIAPILTEKGRLAPSLALVTIKVHPKTRWPTERDRDRALYRVQQVLDRCVLPDLDAVLPAQNKSGSDFFVVAARTDGRGSEVLLARIREQLSHCMHLKEAGVNCTAGCEVMDLYQATAGLPADQHEQRVVTQLLERLEAKFNRETENHGR